MNVIEHAIKAKLPYDEKVELFAKHGNAHGLTQTFRIGNTPQNRRLLDYQLKRLKWRKDLPKVTKRTATITHRQTKENVPTPTRPPSPIDSKPTPDDRLYPPTITDALRDRQKAINDREKAGRRLTEEADGLSPSERAALVATQKAKHKVVVEKTTIINAWKNSGIIPEKIEVIEKKELENLLSDEKKAELEKEWRELMRVRTRAEAGIKKWTGTNQKRRLQAHKDKLKRTKERLDTLRILLNKKRSWRNRKNS